MYSLSEFRLLVYALCRIHDCSETSGIRTLHRSALVGGAPQSRHLVRFGGKAADVVPDDNSSAARGLVVRDARKLGLTALDESDHVHIHDFP
jgi:hypothetical protein